MLLRVLHCASVARCRKAGCGGSTGIGAATRALTVLMVVKCHSAHMFSRRRPWQRYRNLIKAVHSRASFQRFRHRSNHRLLDFYNKRPPDISKSYAVIDWLWLEGCSLPPSVRILL